MLELRASKIGGCVRAYVLDLRHGRSEITVKQSIYFAIGKALEPIIMKYGGHSPSLLLNDEVRVEIPINDGLMLTGHPDGLTASWVIECKSMRTSTFKKMVKHGMKHVLPSYLVQGSIYCKALGRKGVKYLCLDKDASVIKEVRVPWVDLEPYYEAAVTNALKIASWLDKKRLPGKDPDLPYEYCLEGFCDHQECRHHMVHRRRTKPVQVPKEKKSAMDSLPEWDGSF